MARKKEAAPIKSPGAKRIRRPADELIGPILQVASAEFQRLGYANATTLMIAKKAGVTEAQLFRYFGTKTNLFRESVFRPLDVQLAQFALSHHLDRGPASFSREGTAAYIGELRQFLAEHADLIASLLNVQSYEQGVATALGPIASLNRYFDRGAATMRGVHKGKLAVKPELMVRVSFAAVLACVMFRDWLFPAGIATESEIVAAIDDFVMDGLGANEAKPGG